jgi:hypothetical protein
VICLAPGGTEPLCFGLSGREIACGTALADFTEAESSENGNELVGFEDGDIPHGSADGDVLNPNKLRFQHRLAVFQKHRYYFS